MSLVVHKLVLNPTSSNSSVQNSQAHRHVTVAAYTTPRSISGDDVSDTYESVSSSSMVATSVSSASSTCTSHSSSRTYNLPFVLQDHNYGAPPPPTPPNSPPPVPTSSQSSQSTCHSHHSYHYKPNLSSQRISQVAQSSNTTHHAHARSPSHCNVPAQSRAKTQIPALRSNIGLTGGSYGSASAGGLHGVSSLQRPPFMPHPKSSVFPSPHIPPPPVDLIQGNNTGTETDDDSRLSDRSSSVGPSGEETETAPEGEGDEPPVDDSITRCICDFTHDDGYMIQCDRCFVWQHVDCMEIDRNNIPDEYLCEACAPRIVDRFKARALQIRRRQEIKAHLARLSSSDSEDNNPPVNKSRYVKTQERKVLKKKKIKHSKDVKGGKKNLSNKKTTTASVSAVSPSVIAITNSSSSNSNNNNNNNSTVNNNINTATSEDKDRKSTLKLRRRKSTPSGSLEIDVLESSSNNPEITTTANGEDYEIAVTNHYSPELRARVHSARINGISADLRASTQSVLIDQRCRVIDKITNPLDSTQVKVLVATVSMKVNTAIIEYQGKYLLASQWVSQQNGQTEKYTPFVLLYEMPKEGLSVCVDARTYGNDARFVRRSCKPNVEVRHVIERGSLHLYIVTTRDVAEDEEILLPLETVNAINDAPCACPEQHDSSCKDYSAPPSPPPPPPPLLTPISNECPSPTKKQSVPASKKKKQLSGNLPSQRSIKRTSSVDLPCEEPAPAPLTPPPPNPVLTPVKQRRTSGSAKSPVKSPSVGAMTPSSDESGKESSSSFTSAPETPEKNDPSTCSTRQQEHKMTREERKIAAYVKFFEQLEKQAQRKQELEKRKEEGRRRSETNITEDEDKTSSADEAVIERPKRRGRKASSQSGTPQKHCSLEASSGVDLTGDDSSCTSGGVVSPGGPSDRATIVPFNSPAVCVASNFRFPKTKKSLMKEWLSETVDPVIHHSGSDTPGVQPCYMRSLSTPTRRPSSCQEVTVGSAKKRWLRQAISEESEPLISNHINGSSSPNSRPESPAQGSDYITPLKKRRVARESMSSELSVTPPTTPVHSADDKDIVEEMEAELAEDGVSYMISNSVVEEGEEPLNESVIAQVQDNARKIDRSMDGSVDCADHSGLNHCAREHGKASGITSRRSKKVRRKKVKPPSSKVRTGKSPDEMAVDKVNCSDNEPTFKVDPISEVSPDCLLTDLKVESELKSSVEAGSDDKHVKVNMFKEEEKETVVKSEVKEEISTKQDVSFDCKKSVADEIRSSSAECNDKFISEVDSDVSPVNVSDIKEEKDTSSKHFTETDPLRQQSSNFIEDVTLENGYAISDHNQPDIVNCSPDISSKIVRANADKVQRIGPRTPEGSAPSSPVGEVDNQRTAEETVVDGVINRITVPNGEVPELNPLPQSSKVCTGDSVKTSVAKSRPDDSAGQVVSLEDNSCLKSPQVTASPAGSSSFVAAQSTPVKRKLSILEYRQRKSITSESEDRAPSGPVQPVEGKPGKPSDASCDDLSSPMEVSSDDDDDDENNDAEGLLNSDVAIESHKHGHVRTRELDPVKVKWDATPTALERQRENLTERLRREFGLLINDEAKDQGVKEDGCLFDGGKHSPSAVHNENGPVEDSHVGSPGDSPLHPSASASCVNERPPQAMSVDNPPDSAPSMTDIVNQYVSSGAFSPSSNSDSAASESPVSLMHSAANSAPHHPHWLHPSPFYPPPGTPLLGGTLTPQTTSLPYLVPPPPQSGVGARSLGTPAGKPIPVYPGTLYHNVDPHSVPDSHGS